MYVIQNINTGHYFSGACGASCVSFAGELSGVVKCYDTEKEALDEIDGLPEKMGPYVAIPEDEL